MRWLTRWFDDDVDWYPPVAILLGLYALYQAATLGRWTVAGWPRPTVIAAVCGLIFGVFHLLKMPWAKWFGIPWVVFLAVVPLVNGMTGGWTMGNIAGLIVLLIMAAHFGYLYFFDSPAKYSDSAQDPDEAGDDEPFLSLVLLFREHRYLDAAIVAALAAKAWKVPVSGDNLPTRVRVERAEGNDGGGDEDEDAAFVLGEAPLFIARHADAMMLIHHHDRPYFDDPAAVAEDMVELRLAHAVAEHQAWTSVDVVRWIGDPAMAEDGAYRLVARLLAELADDNVMAVLDPAAGQIFAYDPETERKLRGDNPLAELRKPYYVPVIRVPDDDPAMLAAVAEARQRWPEFVAAFEQREHDSQQPYSIKAPIGPEGEEEYIWVNVTGIESDVIYGTLGNEPARLPGLKLGDRVRVPVAKINDWLYLAGGEPCGGFTLKVIADHSRRGDEAGDQND